jgi:16S rRNA (guanine527-N7)-methyltransferase
MNLTGIKEHDRLMSELFLDSLVPVPYLPSQGRMLDVGSGAGFPAIVIKILLPGLKLQLVESNSKKANFIKQIIRLLKISDVEVINGRLETVGNKIRLNGFDVVTARALTNLKEFVTWCSFLLSPDGMLIYYSGSRVEESLKSAEDVLKAQHMSLDKIIPYYLPGMQTKRNIVVLRRNSHV